MSRRAGVPLVVTWTLLVASSASAQLPADAAHPPGTATIRGRVTDAGTGRPLRRATVNIFSMDYAQPQRMENRSTSTDAEGRYEFTTLAAGEYSVSASKQGYGGWTYGQERPREGGRPIAILDRQTIERVDIALPAAAIVAGRVVDEFGDAAEDVNVSLARFTSGARGRGLAMMVSTQTNDAGEFRLTTPQPGQYYVYATARAMNLPPDITERVGWARTFYPSTIEAGEARRITIAPGQTIANIVIALIPMRPVRLSGTAFSSQGRPLIGGVTAVRRGELFMNGPGGNGPIRPDGTFVISGLAAGEYQLQVNGPSNDQAETASMDVAVGNDDVENVALVSQPPLTATGRIVIDPAATGSPPSGLRVGTEAAPVNSVFTNFGPPAPPSPVNADFTFEVKSRPGMRRFVVTNLTSGWRIKSVRAGIVDLTDTGIEFRPGGRVSNVDIELTNVTTTVSGTVKTGRGELATDYTVAFIVEDRERWGLRSPRSVRPNQNGEFRLTGLPAGDYYVVALASLDFEELGDPDFLDKAVRIATRMTIADGETKTLDLRLARTP